MNILDSGLGNYWFHLIKVRSADHVQQQETWRGGDMTTVREWPSKFVIGGVEKEWFSDNT